MGGKTVSNGKESIVALEKDNYDLIFMDISMPVMNGLDAANIIKKILNGVKYL